MWGEKELKLRGEAKEVKGTMEINKFSLDDFSQKLVEVKSGGGCPCQGSNQTRPDPGILTPRPTPMS